MTAEADLTQAALLVAPLAWRKPIGGAAKASARVVLAEDKLVGIDQLQVDGPALELRGSMTVTNGRLDTLRLDRAVLGRTDLRGSIRFPHGGPIGLDLTGPALDISSKILEKSPKRDPAAPEAAGSAMVGAWPFRTRSAGA